MRRINIHSLKRSLDRLCLCLDDLYQVNCGGCCYVAFLIARHLDRLGIEYNLSIYNFLPKIESDIIKEVTCMLRSTGSSVIGTDTCEHYCISIVGGGSVNEGDVESLKRYDIKEVTHKNIRWIYKHGLWNNCYDTCNNKIVKGIIDSFFRKYE